MREAAATAPGGRRTVAASVPMREAFHLAGRYAAAGLPLLIVGETGTGKEVVARHAHGLARPRRSFVDVNCGALPRDLVEGLLFGFRRGAFTGAAADTAGLIEEADQGTLFLDELCSLAPEAQAKLLRVIETGEVRRLGDAASRRAAPLVMAAMQDEQAEGSSRQHLRSDLYYRLAVGVIRLLPLRERRADILPLARAYASEHGGELDAGAGRVLLAYHWPGNVRELIAVVRRALIAAEVPRLTAEQVARAIESGAQRGALEYRAARPRLSDLSEVGERCRWNVAAMCGELGTSRATLYRRLRASGLTWRLAAAAEPRLVSHSDMRQPETETPSSCGAGA